MPQYFIPSERIRNGVFTADEEESNHIAKAARKRAGEEIELFDGQGNKYLAVIDAINDGFVSGRIKAKLDSPVYKTRLTLCFAPVTRSAAESMPWGREVTPSKSEPRPTWSTPATLAMWSM